MTNRFFSESYSAAKSIFSASARMRPAREASSVSASAAHSSSAAARLPLSTEETYFGCSGASVSVAYQL